MKGLVKIFFIFILITILVVGFLLYQSQKITKKTETKETSSDYEKIITESENIIIEPVKERPILREKNVLKPKIKLLNDKVFQGETLIIEIFGDIEKLFWRTSDVPQKEISFSHIGEKKIALLGIDTREKAGPQTISYTTSANNTEKIQFEILDKDYPITKIVIPPKLAEQGVTTKRLVESITKTDEITLSEILGIKTNTYEFTGEFVYPLDKWINVGGFGNTRQDENGAIRHLGVDLDGKTGDPVYATNKGIIAYAGKLQNFGNSTVINHGLGIYSLYLHMSKLVVKTGENVFAGEKIGEVGNTGDYTLEPHLHFSIKVNGESVNPKNFIEEFNKVLE